MLCRRGLFGSVIVCMSHASSLHYSPSRNAPFPRLFASIFLSSPLLYFSTLFLPPPCPWLILRSRSPPLQAPRRRRPLSARWSRVGPAEEPRPGRTEPRVRPGAQRQERGAGRCLRSASRRDRSVMWPAGAPAAARLGLGNRLLSSLWDKDNGPELTVEGQKLLLQRLCRLCCWYWVFKEKRHVDQKPHITLTLKTVYIYLFVHIDR